MKEFYRKLVDLYAGGELPAELNDQMELASYRDEDLRHDMDTLRNTIDMVKSDGGPEFTEDTYYRVLNQIYAKAGSVPVQQESSSLQYQLPISI
jgi:hypothetical protein